MVDYPGIAAIVAGETSAVTTPVILGTISAENSSNSGGGITSDILAHTVTAGTEVLLLIVMYGPDDSDAGGETTPSSNVDGNFSLLSAASFGQASSAAMPTVGVWTLENPTSGAHNITYGRAAGCYYMRGVAVNLDDTDAADRFGDLDSFKVVGSPSNTVDGALTTEKSNSLIIAWGAWQGNDAAPITEDDGLSQNNEGSTGGGNTVDGVLSVASKTGPVSPGSTGFGFTASVSDDYAYGAIEIRGAG